MGCHSLHPRGKEVLGAEPNAGLWGSWFPEGEEEEDEDLLWGDNDEAKDRSGHGHDGAAPRHKRHLWRGEALGLGSPGARRRRPAWAAPA